MQIPRRFSSADAHPFDQVEMERRSCAIRNPDGSIVFEMEDVEVPKAWSQLASDILISKYVRKAGVSGQTGAETSVKQVVGRIVRTIRKAGERQGGCFDSPGDAEVFEQELAGLLLTQRAAFNSPVWFNLGLWQEYGIESGGGNWAWNEARGEIAELANNYEKPQCSACFIQSVEDDLMSIFGLVKSEARIFKFGSGTGTNFSTIRGRQERLSGGGTSSGLMSFLEVFDRAAGATKSGGTTRRAAKMVCLDADHPEIRDFVEWKHREEEKARALIEAGYDADFNGEAYHTVSGQNANNSVRLSDAFLEAWRDGGDWTTTFRTTGEACEAFPARDLMREICESAWECADPGLQFDTTINDWHTCPNTGPIRASNPCSEFMFLDDSACNLSSINLLKYVGEDGSFDLEGFLHTVRLLILAQEILVDASSYPTRSIAENSHLFRPLGLGYANLGALLMVYGLPYDSDGGRALAGVLTAVMTGAAYRASAEIAAARGPFKGFEENREPMLRVLRKHREAVDAVDANLCLDELLETARTEWDGAIAAAEAHGCRNAQVSVLAPTGTIGLLMDCDTTGVEPDYALVKFKRLAGGGFFKIVNQAVRRALRNLGYGARQIDEILTYVLGTQSLENEPAVNREALKERGLTDDEIARAEASLGGVFELREAFHPGLVGEEALARLGFKPEDWKAPGFDLLGELGFSEAEVAEACERVCGTMTIEGAPHLDPEHYAVFDCANRCGAGERMIAPTGHLKMMGAVQPFISGAISKTVNLPNKTTVEEIQSLYVQSWEMGLKAVALYCDGCKSSQPLSTGKKQDEAKSGGAETPEGGQLELFPELAEFGPRRRPLPKRRRGITVESRVAGHKVFLRTGEYDDAKLGEIFIDMHKEGSSFRSMMMCFAIAVSKGLQYGVPLREFVDTFTFTNFEPKGVCDHPNIKMATSVIDYVFRVLGMEYLGRTDFLQVKPEEAEAGGPNDEASDLTAALEHLKGGGVPSAPSEPEPPVAPAVSEPSARPRAGGQNASPVGRQLQEMGGDAPFCDVCGHITVRNGACYKCLNCGNSMGCS